MKYVLYGNDIDQSTNPIEAGLGWITKMNKQNFIGKERLNQIKSNLYRELVCIEMIDKHINYEILGSRIAIDNLHKNTDDNYLTIVEKLYKIKLNYRKNLIINLVIIFIIS